MPHVTIEFSANTCTTTGGPVDIDGLVDAVHDAAIATGIAPMEGLRTRAVGHRHVAIGDRHPDNRFIAVTARLGPGRSTADRHRLAEALIDAVESFVGPDVAATAMLSAEVQEIDPATRINRNHLRPVIAERARRTNEER